MGDTDTLPTSEEALRWRAHSAHRAMRQVKWVTRNVPEGEIGPWIEAIVTLYADGIRPRTITALEPDGDLAAEARAQRKELGYG